MTEVFHLGIKASLLHCVVFRRGVVLILLLWALFHLLLILLARALLFTGAVLFDQFVECIKVVEDMDATPSVQVCGL